MFRLPVLPYAYDALEPTMSASTLRFHHDEHHAAYVKGLNAVLAETRTPQAPLETVILEAASASDPRVFNNAGQAWNHSVFWQCMSPTQGEASSALRASIDRGFGGSQGLRASFVTEGAAHFGSGWLWLAADAAGDLRVLTTHDAHTILGEPGLTPILVCDLWEHAYYLDRQNNRKGYLEAWLDQLANWDFASRQFAAARGERAPWRHPAPDQVFAAVG